MTIDEHIEQAKECAKGITIHADSMGWRVTQLVLAEEVERLRGKLDAAESQAAKLVEALEYCVKQIPEFASVPGIAAALAAYKENK